MATVRQRRVDQLHSAVWQPCIGVQEQQHVAVDRGCARIHLTRAAAVGANHPKAGTSRDGRAAILAVAVDEQDLDAAASQRQQVLEQRRERARLIQYRDDDRQIHGSRHPRFHA